MSQPQPVCVCVWTAAKYLVIKAGAKNKPEVCFCKDFIICTTAAATLFIHAPYVWPRSGHVKTTYQRTMLLKYTLRRCIFGIFVILL